MGREQVGTMGLYAAAFQHARKSGASREVAYRTAIRKVQHRPPVSQLSNEEIDRVVAAFEPFDNPWEPGALLKRALQTRRGDFLCEPYLSSLRAGSREE